MPSHAASIAACPLPRHLLCHRHGDDGADPGHPVGRTCFRAAQSRLARRAGRSRSSCWRGGHWAMASRRWSIRPRCGPSGTTQCGSRSSRRFRSRSCCWPRRCSSRCRRLAHAVWLVGTALQGVLALSVIGAWIGHRSVSARTVDARMVHPGGGQRDRAAGRGARLGYIEISWLFFSGGLIFWVVLLTLVMNRLMFHDPLPGRMVPTLMILVAPPAVAFTAWLRLIGRGRAVRAFPAVGGLCLCACWSRRKRQVPHHAFRPVVVGAVLSARRADHRQLRLCRGGRLCRASPHRRWAFWPCCWPLSRG